MVDERALEHELREVGAALADAMPVAARHPVRALDERAMALATEDAELRAALLRFVDVVPACRSPQDLADHLLALLDEVRHPPAVVAAARRMASLPAGQAALGAAAARGVRHVAHRFIAGAAPQKALPELERLWRRGVASSLDLLGEATVTQAEADSYAARCAGALQTVSAAAPAWAARPALERDEAGPLPRANLSVKVSGLTPLLRPDAPARGRRDAAPRLRELLRRARECGAHLHVDTESLDTRDAVLELILDLLAEAEFAAGPSAGVVIQAYLRDSPEVTEAVIDRARAMARESPLTVRLVKGAYWDHEVVQARAHGWAPPVFEDKAECDANFEALTRRLLDVRPAVRVAVASHNLRSVAHAIAYDRLSGRPPGSLEIQVLRGLGDPLGEALADLGFRVRAYCPVGDLVAGMAYLVRRLLENTANESFLHLQAAGVSLSELLDAPAPARVATPAGGGG